MQTKTSLILILDNLRSAQNVGSIFRTADACGAEQIITCGYTPHPPVLSDPRPAHHSAANLRAIAKTALGAEQTVAHQHLENAEKAIAWSKRAGYVVAALEQAPGSTDLLNYNPPSKIALILGNEVDGICEQILQKVDVVLEIPMRGQKESLNVAVAGGIAAYHLTT